MAGEYGRFSRLMKFFASLFWTVLFVTATFLWVVVFEHGFGDFSEGAWKELDGLRRLINGD